MKIYVVGIGPGSIEHMTPYAQKAIEKSDVVVGYTVYVDLVKELTEDKEVLSTPMKKEVDRCQMALDAALENKTVAFVCSGDAGVYGMAGIMIQVAKDHPEVDIEVVPGITAACSGAALLGAPLIHDFSIISLSDLLTPWDLILKRVKLAAESDMSIVLYNPKSKKRRDYIDKAVDVILEYRLPDTPAGYVKMIGREGETTKICKLTDLKNNDDIDMFTTVFIGNSTTEIIDGKIVTPRGYKNV